MLKYAVLCYNIHEGRELMDESLFLNFDKVLSYNAFLTMLHYQLNLNNKDQEYSEQDKMFLKKRKGY